MVVEVKEAPIQALAGEFRRSELKRIGGKEFACRLLRFEHFFYPLNEAVAQKLAFNLLNLGQNALLKGYMLLWFDGMGFGEYTCSQVLKSIGVPAGEVECPEAPDWI